MKEIERHLCAQCGQEMKGAFRNYEELKAPPARKEECDWCHRPCFGTRYRIFFGRKEE